MRKTGPNDASSVVWALGEFFLYWCFLILTCVLRHVDCVEMGEQGRKGQITGGAQDMSRLEPQVCFYYYYLLFLIY